MCSRRRPTHDTPARSAAIVLVDQWDSASHGVLRETLEHVLVGPERKPIPDIDLSRTSEDDAARVPMIDHWREWLTTDLEMQGHYSTPAEAEGWTIETATFTKRAQFDPLPLGTIPARLFSQVMRDIDLIVSVAHRGGVDPEASASTIEMRASPLRETCRLLNLANVRVEPPRVRIDGTRASYTLHLGSAGAAIGGRALVIVAVHAAHRGRLFLPFAHADPKTAEVMSKALLLARDQEIADPVISVSG